MDMPPLVIIENFLWKIEKNRTKYLKTHSLALWAQLKQVFKKKLTYLDFYLFFDKIMLDQHHHTNIKSFTYLFY